MSEALREKQLSQLQWRIAQKGKNRLVEDDSFIHTWEMKSCLVLGMTRYLCFPPSQSHCPQEERSGSCFILHSESFSSPHQSLQGANNMDCDMDRSHCTAE